MLDLEFPHEIDERLLNRTKLFLEEAMPHVDWTQEDLQETPRRFVEMLRELSGYTDQKNGAGQFKMTMFDSSSREMVIMKNIPFAALCAHHLVPFVGTAHVAYLPDDKVVGLSKIARAVRYFARGLWDQESLTNTIAVFLEDTLDSKGVAVVMEAEHQCMTLRGVQATGTSTTTSSMRGIFLDRNENARHEFLALIGRT